MTAHFGDTRTEVAAKVVSKKGLDKDQIGWIREEIAIHKRLRHPNIRTLHGSFESLSKITLFYTKVRNSRRAGWVHVPFSCVCPGSQVSVLTGKKGQL